MKNLINKIIALVVLSGLLFSFTTIKNEKKTLKLEESKVVWKGYKVTGAHEGTIAIKSGSLTFDNNKLVGGEIVINMTSIINTDMTGEYKGKLEGHLKSDDFFGVEKHPTASLVFNKVEAKGKNSYSASGDLTIKGITHSVTFIISVYGNKASASLKIDRSKFDVRYGSASFFDNLKDKAIYDEFDIIADLEF